MDATPKEPLKASGELWSVGWDCPTRWAIDADNQCWCNDAHGGDLALVTSGRLLSEAETDSDKNMLRKILGMKPQIPAWISKARAAGWTPPADWDESQYEP